jgi:hypothetical protein
MKDEGKGNWRERNRQEGTIAKQVLEIKVFKNAMKRYEGEQKRTTEMNEAQREELGKFEGERNRQEGIIAKQASEIEVFKNTTKKCEDELKHATEMNETQGGELARLKDKNKVMKAKEDRLMEEFGKLKEEI